MKEGLILALKINYWLYFNRLRYSLFAKLVDDGMVILFAYKKVAKLSKEECYTLLNKLYSTSKAYKQGYSDGDYWNGSQNPYHFKNDYKNWLEYESGFSKCKEDKKKYWTEIVIKETEQIDIEKYKKLLEQHKWDISNPNEIEERNNLLRLASTSNEFQRAYFKAKEKWQPFNGR